MRDGANSSFLSVSRRVAQESVSSNLYVCAVGPFWQWSAFQKRLGSLSSRSDNHTLGIFVGRGLKGVRELNELGCHVVELGAYWIVRSHWIARSARKPAVEPSRPVDTVGELSQVAFTTDDLLGQLSRLRQATVAVLQRRRLDRTVVVFHTSDCGPSVRGTSAGKNPAGYFYICNRGEL